MYIYVYVYKYKYKWTIVPVIVAHTTAVSELFTLSTAINIAVLIFLLGAKQSVKFTKDNYLNKNTSIRLKKSLE